jgi:hypothetical protein
MIFEHRRVDTLARFELKKGDDSIFALRFISEPSSDYSVVNPNSATAVAFLENTWLLLWTETYYILYKDTIVLCLQPSKEFKFKVGMDKVEIDNSDGEDVY